MRHPLRGTIAAAVYNQGRMEDGLQKSPDIPRSYILRHRELPLVFPVTTLSVVDKTNIYFDTIK
jgi:hypothetical protein